MSDRDTAPERYKEQEDETHTSNCTCGENEACDECAGETDEEERPISVDLSRSEAVLLLHVAWEKKLEMAEKQAQTPMAGVMSEIGLQVGREIYSEEMVEWIEKQHEEREEMMEEMMESVSGMMGGDGPFQGSGGDKLGFR